MDKTHVVISYIPFFEAKGGVFQPEDKQVADAFEALSKLDDVQIKGVAWVRRGIITCPCFIVDNYEALEKHLLMWSENKPEDWFYLIWEKDSSGNSIALIPNITKNRLGLPEDGTRKVLFYAYFFSTRGAPYKPTEFILPDIGRAEVFFGEANLEKGTVNSTDGITVPCYREDQAPEAIREIFRAFKNGK